MYLNGRRYDEKVLEEISNLVDISKEYAERQIKNGEIYRYTREERILYRGRKGMMQGIGKKRRG